MITNPINVVLSTTAFDDVNIVADNAEIPANGFFPLINNSTAPVAMSFLAYSFEGTTIVINGLNAIGASIREELELTANVGELTTYKYTSIFSIQNVGDDPASLSVTRSLATNSVLQRVVPLDQISMSGLTVQTIAESKDGGGNYQIGGTILPLFYLPTFSGSTTGGITPNPTLGMDFNAGGFAYAIIPDQTLTADTPSGAFYPNTTDISLSGLLIEASFGAGVTAATLQVAIQQQTSVSR